ncbi:MAG: hypothetical protein QXX45_03365 [Candidatus Aenigmatarchaeota archaeon]
MKNKDLVNKLIELSEKFNCTISKMETAFSVQSEILRQINDQNKLHQKAIEANTQATKDLSVLVKEQTKSFNRFWYIFWIVIMALIVLAGGEKVFQYILKLR